MTWLDISGMADEALLERFIIERRGSGVFLAGSERSLLSSWLQQAGRMELLLGILEQLLPPGRALPLRFVAAAVDRRIQELRVDAGAAAQREGDETDESAAPG